MKRVLFVDDDAAVLTSLERTLRAQRADWEMVFALGGRAGLDELERSSFDVVVSAGPMPDVDGAQILAAAKTRHPAALRIALTGRPDDPATRRIVPFAHQFLGRLCPTSVLVDVIARGCELQALLHSERLRRLVGSLGALPVLPRTYAAFTAAVNDPEVSIGQLARIVTQDPGLTAKVLQLTNSASFGLARRVTNIKDALAFLGISTIRNLLLVAGAMAEIHGGKASATSELEQSHALAVARLVGKIADPYGCANEAILAGLLHDIGRVLLAVRMPEWQQAIDAELRARPAPIDEAETRVHAASHAEVGAYLLGLWGLPQAVVEAVAHHHRPQRVPAETFGVLGAVHVAETLLHEVTPCAPGTVPGLAPELDMNYLARAGVADQLPLWREIVAESAVANERSERSVGR